MYRYNSVYDYGSGFLFSDKYNVNDRSYWEKSLFQRARSIFIFDGLPDQAVGQVQTDYDAFLYGLFKLGYLVVFETTKYGITFQPGSPAGYGLQYQPAAMNICSPWFNFNRALEIGTECEVIKLTPDYCGIWDIISKYAEELMYNDVALRLSAINARFAYAISAADDKGARTVKALMEKLENAEPAITIDPKLNKSRLDDPTAMPWQQFDRDLKKNFIYTDLIEARRMILTDFYRELGVQSASDKRERENVLETTAYQAETFNRRQVWELSLKQSIERVNRLYNLNITFKYNELKGGALNGAEPLNMANGATAGNS